MTFNQRRQRSPLTLRRWRLETLGNEKKGGTEKTMTVSKERFSFYAGIGTIVPWAFIIFFYIVKGVGAMANSSFLIATFIAITTFQVIGLILGVVCICKKSCERKRAILGLILNVPCLLVIIPIAAQPFITKQIKYIPSTQEIVTKSSEFLIQPANIEGVEGYKGKGNPFFMYKYKSNSSNFIDELERDAAAKGWIKLQNSEPASNFVKEIQVTKKGITLFSYQLVRVLHDNASGKTCVGHAEIDSFEKIPDIYQAPDTQILERVFWSKLSMCISNQ